jgi:pimeloyl-ACP methyl ester carboxylesterase
LRTASEAWPPQFDALPPDLRELGPAYRAANAEGTRRWLELEHRSRQDGAPAQPFRNRLTFALLEKIKVSTFLITSEADMFAPPPLLKLFTARIKDSKSMVIPEAGHSSYWEQPEIFNNAVLAFIKEH